MVEESGGEGAGVSVLRVCDEAGWRAQVTIHVVAQVWANLVVNNHRLLAA